MKLEGLETIEFYCSKDDENKILAEYVIPAGRNTKHKIRKLIYVDDPEFASYLRLVVIPNLSESVDEKEIIRNVKDFCRVYGCEDEISIKVRTAGKLKEGVVEYAIYDLKNRYVRVDSDGYEVIENPEHKFIKPKTCIKQLMPVGTKRNLLDIMRPYVSASENMFLLFIVWLVQSFCEGNHCALLITAEAGAGKTTLSKIIRLILDPSRLGVNKLVSKGDNLITTLTNSYLVAFDNMRELSKDESDTLCVAVTGGTYTKREAYSTNDLAIYNLHNTIIINGIDIWPQESDFAQRCICLELKTVEDDKRRCDYDIEQKFKEDLPEILHCIFETISKAMTLIHNLKPKRGPRMLDAYTEMLAIALALGITEEQFEKIYFKNIEHINKMRANNDLVFAIREYMDNHVKGRSFKGTATNVYAAIRNNYSGNRAALPGSASKFSQKAKSEYASLMAVGYTLNVDDTHADGTHIQLIKNK